MESEIVWLAPLLILPGVCLLIVSTSARYATLHDEIHHWLDGAHDPQVVQQAHLLQRAFHFRNALVCLYSSVFIFVGASVIGAVLDFMDVIYDLVVFAIVVVGTMVVGYASAELVRESLLSLQVIQAHVDHIIGSMDNH